MEWVIGVGVVVLVIVAAYINKIMNDIALLHEDLKNIRLDKAEKYTVRDWKERTRDVEQDISRIKDFIATLGWEEVTTPAETKWVKK